MANGYFICILATAFLLKPSLSAECSLGDSNGPEVHHFQCSHYYTLLEKAIRTDRNELHWLVRNFFPEDGYVPYVMKMSVVITVGDILGESCTRNEQPPAFSYDGAVWVGKWTFQLSASAILTYISQDVLLAFDNTLTWAVYTMATGIGGHGSLEHEVRFHINKLFCNPSRAVMTEVLIIFLSRIKYIAITQGRSVVSDNKNKLYVSEGYYTTENGNKIVVLENSPVGWKLLLATFVLQTLLVTLFVLRYYTDYKSYFMDTIVNSTYTVYHCIYVATVFVTFCLNFINLGVFTIGLLFSYPSLDTTSSKVVFTTKIVMTTFVLAAVMISVTVFIFKQKQQKRYKRRCSFIIINLLALVNLPLFLYSITVAFIPIAVLLVLYPPQVLSSLAFIFSGLFCIVIIVAHIVFMDRATQQNGHKELLKICLQVLIFLIFVALICILIVFHLLLQSRGLNANGLQGFLLSLIPSVILSLFGHFMRKNFFNRNTPSIV